MTQRTPPSWLQNGSHPAENDRLTQQALIGAANGVIGASSYAVTAQASPNMTVNIASGYATLVGATTTSQGSYVATNDATVVQTITTADATNPRIDIIFLQVNDAAYTGSTNSVTLSYLTGTPAASPAVPAPTGSATYYILAQIAVAANATTIPQTAITDLRTPAQSPLIQGNIQTTRLTASTSSIGSGTNIFGATTRPGLIGGRTYSIDAKIVFTKTTTGIFPLGFAISGSATMTGALIAVDSGPTTAGVVVTTAASQVNLSTSTSYTTSSNYVVSITGTITPTATGRLSLYATSSVVGTIVALAGSYFTVTDLGTSANIGNIG